MMIRDVSGETDVRLRVQSEVLLELLVPLKMEIVGEFRLIRQRTHKKDGIVGTKNDESCAWGWEFGGASLGLSDLSSGKDEGHERRKCRDGRREKIK